MCVNFTTLYFFQNGEWTRLSINKYVTLEVTLIAHTRPRKTKIKKILNDRYDDPQD